MARDNKARYGYQPRWDLQKKKQREVAANRDQNVSVRESNRGGCPECGAPLFAAENGLDCGECDHFEPWGTEQ